MENQFTKSGWLKGYEMLKAAFPSLDEKFFDILLSRLKANRFTDDMFIFSVVEIIDHCNETPTIAKILSYKIEYLEEQEYRANYKPPTPEEIAQKEKERQAELERRDRETEEFNRKLMSGEIT